MDIAQHFSVFSKALDLRTQRHQVLASNIANADTPGYKARDFEFGAAMQNAIQGRSSVGGVRYGSYFGWAHAWKWHKRAGCLAVSDRDAVCS
jgi:hypothetical protein